MISHLTKFIRSVRKPPSSEKVKILSDVFNSFSELMIYYFLRRQKSLPTMGPMKNGRLNKKNIVKIIHFRRTNPDLQNIR